MHKTMVTALVMTAILIGGAFAYPLTGTVTEVKDGEVVIELSSGATAKAGDLVELFFVTGSGVELPVGNLVVATVSGRTLRASVRAGETAPRKGLKAVVSAGTTQPSPRASTPETQPTPPVTTADSKPATRKTSPPAVSAVPAAPSKPQPAVSTVPAAPSKPERAVPAPAPAARTTAESKPSTTTGVTRKGRVVAVSGGDVQVRFDDASGIKVGQEVTVSLSGVVAEPVVIPAPVVSTLPAPTTGNAPGPNAELTQMLGSGDAALLRKAAMTVHSSHGKDLALCKEVEKALLAGYMEHGGSYAHVDAMSWMCRVLGDSGHVQFRPTLEKVLREAPNPKLKKYAARGVRTLR